MLWKLDNTEIYILGSIHVTNMNPLRLPTRAEGIYLSSTQIIFETDLDGKPEQSCLFLPDNTQLPDLIPHSLFHKAQKHWHRLGLKEADLHSFRPGFAAMVMQLNQAALRGYTNQQGIDRQIWAWAEADGKRRFSLEPFQDQIQMLANSPFEEQISLLNHIVEQDDAGFSELADMVQAWISGDLAYFEKVVAQRIRQWPLTSEILLTNRNRRWVPDFVNLAHQQTPTLAVVGMLHLIGSTSLPALLNQAGISVSRCHDGA